MTGRDGIFDGDADIEQAELSDRPETSGYRVSLEKHGSTWYYSTRNPQGGSFGSHNCGPRRTALALAIRSIPAGEEYDLIINGELDGTYVRMGGGA